MNTRIEDTQPIPVIPANEHTRVLPQAPQPQWTPTPPPPAPAEPAAGSGWTTADHARIAIGWGLLTVFGVLALVLTFTVVVPFIMWLPTAIGGVLTWVGGGVVVTLLIFMFVFACLFG